MSVMYSPAYPSSGIGLAAGGGEERPGVPVDLGAGVVEVVLRGDVGTIGAQESGEGVADGGPPDGADVDRAGGVGGDELEVEFLAFEAGRFGRTPSLGAR